MIDFRFSCARSATRNAAARAMFAGVTVLALQPFALAAQQPRPVSLDDAIRQETFVQPPREIADAVLAPRHLNVTLSNASPDRQWFLNEVGDGPVTMPTFSLPFHDLGGVFVDFRANRARSLTIRNNVAIELISATDGAKRSVQLPAGARVSGARWSPDGRSIAFFTHTEDATHIWVADAATGRSRQLTRTPVLATLYTSFDWTANGQTIAAVLVPDARAPMPVKPAVPLGPQVKLAEEADRNRLRTYASLLATPYDQALLEWHATGQVALIDVQSRAVRKVGQPTMVRELSVAPGGEHVRVTRMVKPFSYVVPAGNFGTVDEVWDLSGRVLATLQERPLNLGTQAANPVAAPGAGGAQQDQQGKREIAWRVDGQGLTFLEQEAAPAGRDTSSAREAGAPARKDRVVQWLPPFDSASMRVLFESDTRMSNHRFSPDHRILFVSERSGQNTVEYAVYLDNTAQRHTLARYRTEDFYANPGTLLMTRGVTGGGGGGGGGGGFGGGAAAGGGTVQLSRDGSSVFFVGTQYDRTPYDVGPKSFIDRVSIRDGQKQRVYESENNGVFERVLAVTDVDAVQLIVSRETPTEVPQSFRRAGGQLTQLTQNRDYTPDLTRAPRQTFTVTRPDGFKFRVNVTLPPNYRQGERLPAMFWFYPREFSEQEEYERGARSYNRNAFRNFGTRSLEFLVRLGYAVVEPDAPIVGPTGRMNDNYVHDLRTNLSVVIDSLDRRGIIDRGRLGIGGHSYGAFSTVNAMVQTPFFKAGIAGDGNYNRTLTPLDFQSERRSLWEARETYLAMSPLLQANNLTGALLMYHGLFDQNVGTDPINSPRLFHALNGLGKTTSMYLYPFEDHGPATLETNLDLWARWTAWLEKYVKNARGERVTTDDASSSR
jgi:dipeptidyl aminopeptidase/acylaminoacyl peptidase